MDSRKKERLSFPPTWKNLCWVRTRLTRQFSLATERSRCTDLLIKQFRCPSILGHAPQGLRTISSPVVVEADGPWHAYQLATQALESLLAHLAVDLRHAFSYRPVEIRDAEKVGPIQCRTKHFQVTQYKLDQVAEALNTGAMVTALEDPRMDRALHYFEHALLLFARRRDLASPLSRHHSTIISAVFLNLWKSVTTIVGDQSRDRDYQRRFLQFGMDRTFFQTKIERLKKYRDNFDVAHYSATATSTDELEAVYGQAVTIAAEVIQHYRDHLIRRNGVM